MTSFDTASATSSPPLARLTITLGPDDQRAVASFMALSGASSRPDAVRELAVRLAAAPAAVREQLAATALPRLGGSGTRRLDARIASNDRDALDRWCGTAIRAQDAIRAALHLSTTEDDFAAELGLEVAPTPAAPADPVPPSPPRRPGPSSPSTQPTPRRTQPTTNPAPVRKPPSRRPPRRPPARRAPDPFAPAHSTLTAPWPPTPRTIPAVEVADGWETRSLLDRLKSGRENIHFAPAWTDEVEAAVEDLVELLGGGDSATIVVGLDRKPWGVHDEDGDRVGSGFDWSLVPVPRPKSIAHDMLVSAHMAGGVDLEARVHRIDDEGGTGAIVELVAYGAF